MQYRRKSYIHTTNVYCTDRKIKCIHTTFYIFNFIIIVIYFPSINRFTNSAKYYAT